MSIFGRALRVVLNTVNTLTAVKLTYRNREGLELRIEGSPGDVLATVQTNDNVTVRIRRGSFLIDAHWLDFGDGPEEPRAGDQLIGCDGVRWETTKPPGGEKVWTWSDRERTRYRVFVEEIAPDA